MKDSRVLRTPDSGSRAVMIPWVVDPRMAPEEEEAVKGPSESPSLGCVNKTDQPRLPPARSESTLN